MKAAVYYNNTDIRIEERPLPKIADREILVKMMASGICGTDVMEWYRKARGPRVMGHEMAGVVAQAGKDVVSIKEGDRVFVSHHVPCFTCHFCREGNYTACESLHSGNYDPGGFSEYVRIPEQNVIHGTFHLPDTVTFEEATIIEPLGCVIRGQQKLSLRKGQTVLIIGSGISGLLHLQMLKSLGATVIMTDINAYRLQKAEELGADRTCHADEFTPDLLRSINNSRLAERVIVCAGAKQAAESAVHSVERAGAILFFAVPQEDIPLPSLRFWRDEISVHFSYGAAPDDLRKALQFIASGTVQVKGLITHRVPLSEIRKGFALVSEPSGSLKVAIVPDAP